MAQPTECDFCSKPRRMTPTVELFYLVEVSGPYQFAFDEGTTSKRSKNKKNLWGCRDCTHMVEDTEFWAKASDTNSPYKMYDVGRRPPVLALGLDRIKGVAGKDDHKAAERFAPEPFHRPTGRRESA